MTIKQQIEQVFTHYQTYHPRSRLGALEEKKIRARLAEGWTVLDLQHAIDGCHRSPFHQGENDRGRKYDSLELIVRDSSKVQQFIELAEQNQTVVTEKTRRSLRAVEDYVTERQEEADAVQGF